MHHLRSILFGTAAILLLTLSCAATKKTANRPKANRDAVWAPIDSLSNIGQYASALKATNTVLAKAQAKHDWRTEFRAWMYTVRFQRLIGIEPEVVIAQLDSAANVSDTPLNQLLHSVVAEQWWSYYQNNRWQILDRTNMAQATEDPQTWDQATFMQKVIAENAASLEPSAELAKLPVGELKQLLLATKSDTAFRPHDLRCARASCAGRF